MEGGRGFTTSCYFALLCLFLRTPATDYSYSESPPTTVTPSISVNLHILSKWQCSEELLILPSGPRGGHLVLEGQLRRIKYFSSRIRYHTNWISTFNPSAFKIVRSDDVETNPGDEAVNISPSNAGSSPKNLRCLLLNARSLRNKVLDLQALSRKHGLTLASWISNWFWMTTVFIAKTDEIVEVEVSYWQYIRI